jgi:arylsulfatase A-like enzyme
VRGRRAKPGPLAASAAAVLSLAAGCRRAPPEIPLRPSAAAAPSVRVDAEGVAREGFVSPASGFEWPLPEGARGRLRFSWTTAAGRQGAVGLDINLITGSGKGADLVSRVLRSFPEAGAAAFFDEDVAVSAGRGARLRFSTTPPGEIFLSDLRIIEPDERADALVLIVFDTTRRDAVGLYGCKDPTTPNIDRLFRGAFQAERAYAPASWTIPSMASLLTGRVPAVFEGQDGAPRGILPQVPTLADDFRRAGWSTGAFVANPTLHAGNGFSSGFTTFFTTPYEPASIALPGSETLRHAPRWLASHAGEPFFLLLLLMDPHDPYTPADRPRGQTPFDPGYTGPIVGDEIHRLQIGVLPRPPDGDIRHLAALYHDEVRLADSFVGELWRQAEPDLSRRATLVFTSDHGEELGEHGGWKHGPALFDEVLRVPLLIRPGNGRRLKPLSPGTLSSLLDVLPTVEALFSLPVRERTLDGLDLAAEAATRREALPAITMLTGGPPRAALVHRQSKFVFFDRWSSRGMPDAAKDPDGALLAKTLPGRLPAFGRFDLLSDPGETKLLPADASTLAADWRSIEGAWSGTRDGLEIRVVGAAAPLSLEIDGFSPEARAEPFGQKPEDRAEWVCRTGRCRLSAELHAEGAVAGFSISGPPSDLTLTARGACASLMLGEARPLSPGEPQAIARGSVSAALPRFAPPKGCAGIFLWRSTGRPDLPPQDPDEAVRKLRALGYAH